tara:strand:+ start:352 stop:486 length:135 start_codon:yes stop_codon:yes gene_type:complete
MDGKEMIERILEVIRFIRTGDLDKAILYLKYLIEDIEMYKNNTL